jgi:hypothetical protein
MTPSAHPGFPAGAKKLFEDLQDHVTSLHKKWILYTDLFADPEDLSVIRDTAPVAFALIEESLRYDMIMSIGRLIDPAETWLGDKKPPKKNLSLARLVEELRHHCDQTFFKNLKQRLKEIRTETEPFKVLRDQHGAHKSLNPDPLPPPTRGQVEKSLRLIAGLMDYVQTRFENGTTNYDATDPYGTGEDLVLILKAHRDRVRAERQERLSRFSAMPPTSGGA